MRWILAVLAAATLARPAAAAPPAPIMQTPVKIAEGFPSWTNGTIALDGARVWVGFSTLAELTPGGYGNPESVRVVSSSNGGATWELSTPLDVSDQASGSYVGMQSVRIAVGNDPAVPGKKLLHAVWARDAGVYYAFRSERTGSPVWSAPARISGQVLDDARQLSLAVSPAGAVHVAFSSYYTSAPAPEGPFGEPTPIPYAPPPGGLNVYTASLVLDAAGTLYALVEVDNTAVYLLKRTAGASAWSAPMLVFQTEPGYLSHHVNLAVADASNYYVALNHDSPLTDTGSLALMVTSDGGRTWTERTVLANYGAGASSSSPTVVVTPNRVITYVSEVAGAVPEATLVRLWRSNDGGLTWSPPAVLKGKAQRYPGVALDAAGKVHLMVGDQMLDWSRDVNLLYYRER